MTERVSVLTSDPGAASDTDSEPTSDMTSDHVSDADWLRKAAAAARLGISERMLDRQLAAGRWPKRVTPEGRVEVQVPRPPAEGQREAERALAAVLRGRGRPAGTAHVGGVVAGVAAVGWHPADGATRAAAASCRPCSPAAGCSWARGSSA